MKLGRVRTTGTTNASMVTINKVVERCVDCYHYVENASIEFEPRTVCRATQLALTSDNLPLPNWCPLPDAVAGAEAHTGHLDITSMDMIKIMEQVRVMAEAVQNIVAATYPNEQDMVRADDALLMGLVERLGALVAGSRKMLRIQDAAVIMTIVERDKGQEGSEDAADQDDMEETCLCPSCGYEMKEGSYCPEHGDTGVWKPRSRTDGEAGQGETSKRHLCPACNRRLEDNGYCAKCDRKFTIM